jgi:hypothetical protein
MRIRFGRAVTVAIVCSLSSLTYACGGGSGGSGGGVKSTVTSVAASCSLSSIQAGGTSQCSATVQGTGNPSQAVNWSVQGGNSNGTVNSSGLYTAPAVVTSAMQVTIIATSVQDSTKSGSAQVTVNPPPAPTVTISASPTTITLGQSTTLAWSSTNAASCAASSAWSGSEPTTGSQSVTPTATGTLTFTLTCSGPGGSASASATLTVNAAQQLTVSVNCPDCSGNPPSATVLLVPLNTEAFTATANQQATFTWVITGPGTMNSSGTTSFYNPPLVYPPSSFSATITVTATNSGQTATATANVTLQWELPQITSCIPQDQFSVRENVIGTTCAGAGFYPGGSYSINGGPASVLPASQPFGTLSFAGVYDSSHFNPRPNTITLSTPAGNGGGTSNPSVFTFLGNQNTVTVNPGAGTDGEIYSLSQGADQNGNCLIYVFDLVSHTALRNFRVGCLTYAISVDETTGFIVASDNAFGVGVWKPDGTQAPVGVTTSQLPLAVSGQGGMACVSEDTGNIIGWFSLTQLQALSITAVSGTPFGVKLFTVADKQYCVIGTVENPGISVVRIPDGNLVGSVAFSGLTPQSQTGTNGGWPLELLSKGSTQTIASYFRADGILILTDVSNPAAPKVTQTVHLVATLQSQGVTGDPFHVAADPTNNRFVIALTDYENNGGTMITRFAAVDASTGAVTALNSTSQNYSAGLSVTPDGKTLIVCQDASCDFQPNQ